MAGMLGVVIGVRAFSSRSVIGRRDSVPCVVAGMGAEMHTFRDIDPGDPLNMPTLIAFE